VTSFDLLYGVENLEIFWWLNRHDGVFMQFSLETHILLIRYQFWNDI
jgi:hypothetical protein